MKGERRINPFLTASLALHILLLTGLRASHTETARPLPRVITLQLDTMDTSRPQQAPEPVVETVSMPLSTPVHTPAAAVKRSPVYRTVPVRKAAPGQASERNGNGGSDRQGRAGTGIGHGTGSDSNSDVGSGIAIPATVGLQTQGIGFQAPVAGVGATGLRLSSGSGVATGDTHADRSGSHGQGSSAGDDNGGKYGPRVLQSTEFKLPSLTKASVKAKVEPVYPPEARRRGLEGEVRVRVKITDSGRVEAAEVLRSSGHASMDKAALEAARRMFFNPARRGGDTVPDVANITFRFSLKDER
ncbi:MAG: energy transducer TonB [bacterium]|nr:energy transducer TonB [bacterium]